MLPIYKIMSENAAVRALLWDSALTPQRLRLWGDGYAEEALVGSPANKPYATFQIVSDDPEHGLTCHNLNEPMLYQFDVYARDSAKASEINRALQSALVRHGFVQTIRHPEFEPDTKLYGAGFDLSYIHLEKKP